MAITPWQHDNPFTPGTTVRAEAVNVKMDGIAAVVAEIIQDLEGFTVRLPPSFQGNSNIPDQTVTERLLYVNALGDMDFYPIAQFNLDVQTTAQNAQLAEQHKNSAASSATSASASSTLAQQWAAKPQGQVVSGGLFSSLHYSLNAASSATLAGKYATEDEDIEVAPGEFSAKHWALKAAEAYQLTSVDLQDLQDQLSNSSVLGDVNNTTSTVSRLSRTTEVFITDSVSVTKTLAMAGYNIGDVVRIHKNRTGGVLTVATSTGNIQLPDGTQGNTHTLSERFTAVITLVKVSSTLWSLSIV